MQSQQVPRLVFQPGKTNNSLKNFQSPLTSPKQPRTSRLWLAIFSRCRSSSPSSCRREGYWPIANHLKLQTKTSDKSANVLKTATLSARAQPKEVEVSASRLGRLGSSTTPRQWTRYDPSCTDTHLPRQKDETTTPARLAQSSTCSRVSGSKLTVLCSTWCEELRPKAATNSCGSHMTTLWISTLSVFVLWTRAFVVYVLCHRLSRMSFARRSLLAFLLRFRTAKRFLVDGRQY